MLSLGLVLLFMNTSVMQDTPWKRFISNKAMTYTASTLKRDRLLFPQVPKIHRETRLLPQPFFRPPTGGNATSFVSLPKQKTFLYVTLFSGCDVIARGNT